MCVFAFLLVILRRHWRRSQTGIKPHRIVIRSLGLSLGVQQYVSLLLRSGSIEASSASILSQYHIIHRRRCRRHRHRRSGAGLDFSLLSPQFYPILIPSSFIQKRGCISKGDLVLCQAQKHIFVWQGVPYTISTLF